MSDFLSDMAGWLVIALIIALAPQIKKLIKRGIKIYINIRIKFCVKKAEKKFCGAKLGTQKKDYVLAKTQKYDTQLQKAGETVDSLVEKFVAVLNTKNAAAKTALQSSLTELVEESTDKLGETIQSKLSKDSGTEDET